VKKMGRPRKNSLDITVPKQKKECIKCKLSRRLQDFYVSSSDLYIDDGRYPVCRICINEKIPKCDPQSVEYSEAIKSVLAELNKPFIVIMWKNSIEEASKLNRKEILGVYLKNIALNKLTKNLTFRESEQFDANSSTPSIPVQNPIDTETVIVDIELSLEDLRSKDDCIKLLGYDPFAGYAPFDQKFLYAELVPYLDEDTLEDQYKISVIIQLLNNSNQIRKMDLIINKLSTDQESLLNNHARIKDLSGIKATIAKNNNDLSKENAIAIKHRGDKKAGRSTLGYIMKDLRDLGFENAEEDYYDMKRAYGMKVTADISNQSIISQLNFDEKDVEDMFKQQRDMILELQNKNEELEERLRLSQDELKKLKKLSK
jgi:hypothetical protein